jgi:regulator of cell morphogenesis and NO signaling
MKLTASIYDIVIFFPQSIDVFDRYNLDYYCNGSKPFLQACQEKNIDAKQVWEDVQKTAYSSGSVGRSLEEWKPEVLADLILRHYGDLKKKLPALRQVIQNIFDQTKEKAHPKIKNVYTCFNELADAVLMHSTSEEELLLRQLESTTKNRITKVHLVSMDQEHQYIGSLINSLRQMTTNYTITDRLSPSANLAWIMLQQFDKELTQRLHLENNVLFPKLKNQEFKGSSFIV